MKPKNLLHQTFNHLTAIGIAGRTHDKKAKWLWRCSCGQLVIVAAHDVKNGQRKDCRCRISFTGVRHGMSVKGSVSPTYKSFQSMIQRCNNPNSTQYSRYGGRGIAICERWRTFTNFLADMGERPKGRTLERIDNDGNYEPGNCRWATLMEQNCNKRTNHNLTLNGQTMCVAEWARHLGISPTTLYSRMHKGWSAERVLTR